MKRKQVLINLLFKNKNAREVYRGIFTYEQKDVSYRFISPAAGNLFDEKLKSLDVDCYITYTFNSKDETVSTLLKNKIPVIVLTVGNYPDGVYTIAHDHTLSGQIAAEHFLEQGLKQFYYVHYGNFTPGGYTDFRYKGFLKRIQQEGLDAGKIVMPSSEKNKEIVGYYSVPVSGFEDILYNLTYPVGIFTNNDETGCGLLLAAEKAGVNVPNHLCVIGVNNDLMLCKTTAPNLTSVELPAFELGLKVGETVHSLFVGEKVPNVQIITSLKLYERESSDFLSVSAPNVSKVLKFIHLNRGMILDVNTVIDQLNVSRRTLERQFKESLGISLYSYIKQQLMEHAEQLIQNGLSINKVCKQCGYNSLSSFYKAFKMQTGRTPVEYRSSCININSEDTSE